ncbi:MAG: beta-lactamase family protein [Bacteroidales bacterium]|nr:beta-lactamase family protein [Bacteroidales bacterium]
MKHEIIQINIIVTTTLLCAIFLYCCEKEESNNSNHYNYKIPELINDGWEVSSLTDEGMNTSVIEEIAENVINDQYKGIHSMQIVRNGFLVFEEYFKGYDRDDLQHIFSITKSVSSSLIGIAIDEGFLQSIEDPVLSFFPQYNITDSIKQKLRLKHILTLTTGFDWDEKTYPYDDSRNSEYQMFQTDDWMEFVLQRPLSHNPGEVYNYNTGSVHLLSSVIKESTGLYANEFAEQYLFQPLGITDYFWNTDNQGFPCTGATHGGLKLKARDVAKYGFLYLNNGKWNNIQVIPEYWIEESVIPRIDIDQAEQFGYLWRIGHFDIDGNIVDYYLSVGSGGQTLIIVPDLDLIIVFLCWNNSNDADILIPTVLILNSIIN